LIVYGRAPHMSTLVYGKPPHIASYVFPMISSR
jgi:hypothetical protein